MHANTQHIGVGVDAQPRANAGVCRNADSNKRHPAHAQVRVVLDNRQSPLPPQESVRNPEAIPGEPCSFA